MSDDALPVTADAVVADPGPTSRTGPFWAAAFVALVVCTNIANASFATLDDENPLRLLLDRKSTRLNSSH